MILLSGGQAFVVSKTPHISKSALGGPPSLCLCVCLCVCVVCFSVKCGLATC